VVEVPACLRNAMMYMFCRRAHCFTCTATSTTEDRPSIRNKLFDALPGECYKIFLGVYEDACEQFIPKINLKKNRKKNTE